jgi:DNA polymerase-3 subunit alpha
MFGVSPAHGPTPSSLIDFPDIPEWGEKERLRREKETLGFYITGHPLERYRIELERVSCCTMQDLTNCADKSQVKIAGVVEELKIKRTKRGDKMAVLNFEDFTGSAEIVVFPDLFGRIAHLLGSDLALMIEGTVEAGENATKIIAHEVRSMDSVRYALVSAIELAIEESTASKALLQELQGVAFKYPGNCRLHFKIAMPEGDEVTVRAGERYGVLPCRELIEELQALVGSKVRELIAPGPPEQYTVAKT